MLPPTPSSLVFVATVILPLTRGAFSALNNVIIDDTAGDERSGMVPAYVPSDGWSNVRAPGTALDSSQVHLGTWHNSTAHKGDPMRQLSFSFTGVALYVFCIITNNPHSNTLPVDRLASYKFALDGQDAGSYRHVPEPSTPNYDYNTLVFSKDGLANELHNFKLQLDPSQGAALILFDYAMYTVSDGETAASVQKSPARSPPPSSSGLPATSSSTHKHIGPNLAAILGGALGGLTFLAILAILFGILLPRCREKRSNSARCPQEDPLAARSFRMSITNYAESSKRLATTLGQRTNASESPSRLIATNHPPQDDVVEEINELRQEVRNLQQEQQWMRQILDEPPPDYDG